MLITNLVIRLQQTVLPQLILVKRIIIKNRLQEFKMV